MKRLRQLVGGCVQRMRTAGRFTWWAVVIACGMWSGSWCVTTVRANFNDALPCKYVVTNSAGNGSGYTYSYQGFQCVNGVLESGPVYDVTVVNYDYSMAPCDGVSSIQIRQAGTVVGSASCVNGGGWFLSWSGMQLPAEFNPSAGAPGNGDHGTCDCTVGTCTGSCQYVGNEDGSVNLVTSDCASLSGCTCPMTVAWQYGGFSVACGTADATCGGSCNYTGVAIGEQTIWSLTSSDCVSVAGCTCPTSPPAGPCPMPGDTMTLACGATGGGSCTPTCSGSCCYTSVADGQGGFTWQASSNSCTAGANNCSCPSGPAGNCPTAAGQTTCVSCGATGGPCTPVPCTGNCNYVAIAGEDAGTFVWSRESDTCSGGAPNCGCPADPGGDCPTYLRQQKSVACGSSSTPCTKAKCLARGGDADNDGCCKDEDVNDNDSSVCSADCKGTYLKCQGNDPLTNALVDCDPSDTDKWGTDGCRCSNAQNGDRDKDGCCDSVDKWPDDASKGCECCDFEKVWKDAGGVQLQAEWTRIMGGGFGPAGQWVVWNSSAQRWDMNGPTGDPDSVTVPVPLYAMTNGQIPNSSFAIPLTVRALENALSGLGVGDFTDSFHDLDTWRTWWRVACAWLLALNLLGLLFQELRV